MSKKRIETLKLFWIEAFLAVHEHGSFEKAGTALACDQSTITRSVTNLEGWLRSPLFNDDIPRALTQYGFNFIPTAKEVVRLLITARPTLLSHTPPRPPISAQGIMP